MIIIHLVYVSVCVCIYSQCQVYGAIESLVLTLHIEERRKVSSHMNFNRAQLS